MQIGYTLNASNSQKLPNRRISNATCKQCKCPYTTYVVQMLILYLLNISYLKHNCQNLIQETDKF